MLVVPKPAESSSRHDQRENIPEEHFRGHGLSLPRTRLAAKCKPIAGKIQAVTPRKDTSSPLPGVKLKVLPRTPTARNAVERRSRLFASSLVRSLSLQLQIRQAVAKRVIFEYRSAAYLKVREHRNADKLLFAARHHEECNCSDMYQTHIAPRSLLIPELNGPPPASNKKRRFPDAFQYQCWEG